MIKILILGASRGVGRCVLDQALAMGISVSVLIRPQCRLDFQHSLLTTYRGELDDKTALTAALENVTSVAMCFGVKPSMRRVALFSESTRLLLKTWTPQTGRRLLCVTGIGAGESRGHGGLVYDKFIYPWILKQVYADKDRQEALIRASTLDWEIIRPGFLTNGPLTGQYRIITSLDNCRGKKISRSDVGHFIISETVEQRWRHRAVLLSS